MIAALEPGQLFHGRYRIERAIGKGGMNTVFRALDTKLETRVAIKTMSEASTSAIERFRREARCIAKVKSKHVVKIYDFGEDDGRPFIAMEYLEGRDLKRLLRKEGPLEISRAVDICIATSRGLAACHFLHELVHRDIKPANIFLQREDDGDEIVKLLDFGVSIYPFAAEITGPMQVAGTLNYMSPEQARGAVVDAKSDQYSLALVLYECLTRRLPYDGPDDRAFVRKLITGEKTPPRTYRPEIPEELEGILLRALSLDPDDRFPNVQEFGLQLRPFASEVGRALFTAQMTAPPVSMPDELSIPNVNDASRPSGASTTKHERDIGTVDNRLVKTVVELPAGGGYQAGGTVPLELDRTVLDTPRAAALSSAAPGAQASVEPSRSTTVEPVATEMRAAKPRASVRSEERTERIRRRRRAAALGLIVVAVGAGGFGLWAAGGRRDVSGVRAPAEELAASRAAIPKKSEAVKPVASAPARPDASASEVIGQSPGVETTSAGPDQEPAAEAAPARQGSEMQAQQPESATAKAKRRRQPAKQLERTNKGSPILR